MNKILSVIIIFLVPLSPISAQDFSSSIADVISKEMSTSKAPGMAYAAIKDGHITASGTEGVLDKGKPEKVNKDSLFIIGSISKSFTALAIMQLVEKGDLQLDAPLSKILTHFSGAALSDVTLRQLLSHTSGLSTLQGNQSQDDFSTDAAALQRRVDSLVTITPAAEADSNWSYSNANYQLLGRIIEVLSGTDYASYIEQNILKPIGMHNSFVFQGEVRDNMANGHQPWFGTKNPLNGNKTGLGSAPQGGVVSSANDMALYMAMMLNAKDDVLSAVGKRQMMSPASAASPNYGLGWFVNSKMGLVFHSGSNPGYESLVTMKPETQEAAVVLVNAGSGYGFAETRQLRYGLSAAALDLPYGGEAGMASKKATFLLLVILPLVFLFGILRLWKKRKTVPARNTTKSKMLLVLPLILVIALAWALLVFVPSMFGATYGAAAVFQPDMGLLLALSAVLAIFWGVLRIFYALREKSAVV